MIDIDGHIAHTGDKSLPVSKERPMAMLLDQRRQEILNVVESSGFVSLQHLTEKVGASDSTVRRDLEYLERIGQIRRTRGGAAYVGESLTTLDERSVQALPEKQAIGKAAAAL